QLLSQLLPVFRRFNSSVVRDVQFTLKTTPTPNGVADFSDTSAFTTADHDFQQIPLGFNFALKFADLPKFKGSYVDGLVLLGGVITPGRGVVPLGLGVGVNQSPADAKVDKQGALPSAGLVSLRMAPAHHGLEGSTYGVVALGASLKSATDSTSGVGGSAIFARVPSNKLVFDPKGATPIDVSGETFLTIQEDAKYNFVSTPYGGIAKGRTFTFTNTNKAQELAGASVVRVTFYGTDDLRWSVVADPSALAGGTFTLPEVPSGLKDRTFSSGNKASGQRSDMLVQTVRLATESGAALSFTQLVENNGTNAERLNDFARAFAIMGYARPVVAWETPANNGTAVKGSAFKVVVSNFVLGTDGYLTVSCGTGTDQSVEATAYSDVAKGEASGNLPAGCSGVVTLTATLVDMNRAPLQPPAAFITNVTLQ
ncbi:MAG: hypothetical protein FJ086_19295, partial [Deltaproteobacteria bacterium]|nr:hypothetical protein [Deltaproteobacteria bacterium]